MQFVNLRADRNFPGYCYTPCLPNQRHGQSSRAHCWAFFSLRFSSKNLLLVVAAWVFSTWCLSNLLLLKKEKGFHRHSRWLYIQQQSSSSSSNRFYWTRRFGPETRAFFEFPGRNVVFNKNDCWKTKNSVVERERFFRAKSCFWPGWGCRGSTLSLRWTFVKMTCKAFCVAGTILRLVTLCPLLEISFTCNRNT